MLKGKTAVITGGTRGIGFAVAKKFLQNGANVAIAGTHHESVEKALKSLEEFRERLIGFCPNICDAEEISKSFSTAKEKFGSLDILVNNAGISSRTNFYNYNFDEFSRIMEINVKSVFVCSQAAAKIMRRQDSGGVIINASSMVTKQGQKAGCGYASSKFAVNGLTISLARELARDKIRVNAVAPGVTRTDMLLSLPQEIIDRVCAEIPLGRIGDADEIAQAYLFLASENASYITGEILNVDGGMCA
jgi:3-oxoacyl-[acyl-carrier protein] reductase/7-alpha-hydroxysteroid dehydrogenase